MAASGYEVPGFKSCPRDGAVLKTLAPTAIEEMEGCGWDLTLFTCTLSGSYRATVRCELFPEE